MKSPSLPASSHTSSRLVALDGLRGLAIVLVILNHLRLDQLYAVLPGWSHPFMGMLTGSGKIGVGVLFMLSGYLMATLYSRVDDVLEFYQKRYTRIFPPFLAMCAALAVLRLYWFDLPTLAIPLVVAGAILGGRAIWEVILRVPQRRSLGAWLFRGFLLLQLLVLVVYGLVMFKVPSAEFYFLWPNWLKHVLYWAVNSTMTLPFGNYAPQLDGVFWSVVAEVYFYLLYPIIILPVAAKIRALHSAKVTAIFYAATAVFLAGLYHLFEQVLGLKLIQVHFMLFFLGGVIIGSTATEKWQEKIKDLANKVPGLAWVVVVFFLLTGISVLRHICDPGFVWESLWLTLPVGLVFLITLAGSNAWSRLLSTSVFVWLGQLSFSLYLTHTVAIEMWVPKRGPETFVEMVRVGGLAVMVMVPLAMLLHWALEHPYLYRKLPKVAKAATTSKKPLAERLLLPATAGLSVMLVGMVWYAYSTPAPLSALVLRHMTVAAPMEVLGQSEYVIPFVAQENNLGVVMLYLKQLSEKEMAARGLQRGADPDVALEIRVTDSQGTEVTRNTYQIAFIFDGRYHPVGFQLQPHSKGQQYYLHFKTLSDSPYYYAAVVNDGVQLRTLYYYGKKELLSNPGLAAKLLWRRASEPFRERQAQQDLVMLAPLLISLGWLGVRKKD